MTGDVKGNSYNVCFIGAGYVGATTAAILALKNPSTQFTVVDNDRGRIAAWNSMELPVQEPGLLEIILKVSSWHTACVGSKNVSPELGNCVDGQPRHDKVNPQHNQSTVRNQGPCLLTVSEPNLHFSTEVRGAVRTADMLFITVNTPSKTSPMEHEWDLSYFDAVLELVMEASMGSTIIVEKSTVPSGNALRISKMVQSKADPNKSFTILSNPEFLNAGSAVADLLDPYSVVIGSPSPTPRSDPNTLSLVKLYNSWIPDERIRLMSTSSSELVKIANNAFEAQRISSINSLTVLCERLGADIKDISYSLGMNPNIGPRFLQAGVGFGGSCLRKDTLGLSGIATDMSMPEVAEYWRQVIVINDFQIQRFTRKVCQYASESSSRVVAILGFAFKKDTNDPRNSIAKDVILALLNQGAIVTVHDPLVSTDAIQNLLPPTHKVRICRTPYEACQRTETIAILNDSKEYTELDWKRISANMEGKKKVVVDGRDIVDAKKLAGFGLVVEKLGKPICMASII